MPNPVIQQQIAFLEAIPEAIEDDLLDVAVEIVEPALPDIFNTAHPRSGKWGGWSTDPAADNRARRWWFANIRAGNIPTNGRNYARQGKPPYGARVDVDRDGDSIFLSITMPRKMRFPFGDILNGRGQNPGHADTGWNLVYDDINRLYADANFELIDRHNARLEAHNKRSTFGKPRR